MSQLIQIAVIAFATLGTGAATMTVLNEDVPDLAVPDGAWQPGAALDGRSFEIVGRDLDSGEVLDDVLVFRDGGFQSVNCEEYCAFGFSDYETKADGDAVHFKARAICPDAPHTVMWHGVVTGDMVELRGTWTTRRWYWTHQIRFEADGAAVPGDMGRAAVPADIGRAAVPADIGRAAVPADDA
jgi:hypothetical protein